MTLKCKSRFRKSVNPETVRIVLRKHKYHGRVPQRKPYMSKANRQARLAFAKMYVRQPTEYWENIIFVYGSKYNIFGSDDKQNVWWKSNTAMDVKNLLPTVKYGIVRKIKGISGKLLLDVSDTSKRPGDALLFEGQRPADFLSRFPSGHLKSLAIEQGF
ncbi:HTH_Tnp_Tc3_2 domain-containing protein [Trichonephila clavipes]|nr:HTH_Tnp_Tc3_2 domain-containing protein [Trichonephila clavipes]